MVIQGEGCWTAIERWATRLRGRRCGSQGYCRMDQKQGCMRRAYPRGEDASILGLRIRVRVWIRGLGLGLVLNAAGRFCPIDLTRVYQAVDALT